MVRQFKVIGKERYKHHFEIGQVVTWVSTYPDGAYECIGSLRGSPNQVLQDLHPMDVKEIKDNKGGKE